MYCHAIWVSPPGDKIFQFCRESLNASHWSTFLGRFFLQERAVVDPAWQGTCRSHRACHASLAARREKCFSGNCQRCRLIERTPACVDGASVMGTAGTWPFPLQDFQCFAWRSECTYVVRMNSYRYPRRPDDIWILHWLVLSSWRPNGRGHQLFPRDRIRRRASCLHRLEETFRFLRKRDNCQRILSNGNQLLEGAFPVAINSWDLTRYGKHD